MTFVRTVLGDIDPGELGVTYAHEHLVIDGGRPVELSPDFLLADVDRMADELRDAAAAGLQTAIDAMPADCGRNPAKLAELSRRTGVQIVAATGLHHERFYGPSHWSLRASEDELADLFVADIEEGIDERDYGGPIVRRTDGPRRDRQGRRQRGRTVGARPADLPGGRARPTAGPASPIHTHCEAGTGALEQIRVLIDAGVAAVARLAEPRRQGRRPRLPPRAALDRRVRRLRPGVPLGRSRQRHDPAHRVGRRGRARRPGHARDGRGPPGLLPRRTVDRPACRTCFASSAAAMEARGARRRRPRSRLFVDNPARAFAFADRERRGRRMSQEPLLTSVVGSHAHPGWFVAGIAAAERGEFGPADLAEMLDDAVDLAIRDQERAGIDVDQRRRDAPGRLLHRRVLPPPDRRPGAAAEPRGWASAAHDAAAPLRGRSSRSRRPTASGVVAEYTAARARTTRPLKVTLPGPYTLSGRLVTGPGEVYATRVAAAEAFVPILAGRARAASSTRAPTIIQVDEPSPAIHPDAAGRFRGAVQRRDRAGRRPGPARRASLLRELPRPAARAALLSPDPATRCSGSTSTSSSSSSPTARWPRSRCCARSPTPGATSRPA